MRLCDEYSIRMGLGPLFLRHSSKCFLFFESGEKLLSVKWLNSSNSSGHYEFLECVLGNVVNVLKSTTVEWSSYEKCLFDWMSGHSGFVFEKDRVFNLSWNFFVSRSDFFLAERYDPFLIYSTLDVSRVELARKIADDIPDGPNSFWHSKSGEILNRYAYWLEGWR